MYSELLIKLKPFKVLFKSVISQYTMAETPEMAVALEHIRHGCAMVVAQEGGSEEAKRLKPAAVLLQEAASITKGVPDAGESVELRWRVYEMIQAQAGGDNAALYKELRCSIHLGLAGEISEPVTLPCGHTYCKTCVAPLFTTGGQRKCPQCREIITVSYASLKPNVAIKGIVAHLLPRGSTYDQDAIAAADAAVAAAATVTASAAYGGSYQYAGMYQQQQQMYGGGGYDSYGRFH